MNVDDDNNTVVIQEQVIINPGYCVSSVQIGPLNLSYQLVYCVAIYGNWLH